MKRSLQSILRPAKRPAFAREAPADELANQRSLAEFIKLKPIQLSEELAILIQPERRDDLKAKVLEQVSRLYDNWVKEQQTFYTDLDSLLTDVSEEKSAVDSVFHVTGPNFGLRCQFHIQYDPTTTEDLTATNENTVSD